MSLAITEQQQQQQQRRRSGCTGVFFKLWGWHRRQAKDQLFSRKLLPSARRANKASQVLDIDADEMPTDKLLLIAEENRGGFPIAKKPELDVRLVRGTRAPGLVARLMGLESMPVSVPEMPDDTVERQNTCGKMEPWSPKLQRTGEGVLGLQTTDGGLPSISSGKSSRMTPPARNKHHKVASPSAKSPRLLAGRPRVRLMQAAAKILEPGAQSRNRARRGICYLESSVANADAYVDVTAAGNVDKSQELLKDSVSKTSMEFDGLVGKSQLDMYKKGTFISGDGSCSVSKTGSDGRRSRPQTRIRLPNKQSEFTERSYLIRNSENISKQRLHSASLNNSNRTQATVVRDKVAFGSKVSNPKPATGDEIELVSRRSSLPTERALNSRTGSSSTYEVADKKRVNTGIISWEENLLDEWAISNSRNKHCAAVNAALTKEKHIASCFTNKKVLGFTGNLVMNRKCIRKESREKDNGDCCSSTSNRIASYTLSSSVKRSTKPFSCEGSKERASAAYEPRHDASSRWSSMDMHNNVTPLQSRIRSVGDQRSTVLEQNVGTVASVGWNESRTRHILTAASILQELIAALIAGDPIPGQSGLTDTVNSSETINSCSHSEDLFNFSVLQSRVLNVKEDPRQEATIDLSGSFLQTKDDHLSPISILEASFSNDSCSFRSLDTTSEGKLPDTTDCWSTSESSRVEPDILDSATSVDIWISDIKRLSDYDNSQCRVFVHSCEVDQAKYELHADAQAVSNAGMLLENFILPCSDEIEDAGSSLESFLLDALEVVLDAIQLHRSCKLKEAKTSYMFKQCLLDCMIECLDSKYNFLCTSGYKNWSKLSRFLTRDQLRREIHKQIRGWMDMSGKICDELIQNEMDNSTGRWTDCRDETFEAVKEIAKDILEALVKEAYSF